jgi:D-glycero-alpha-D-manno-heptose-7-phosphate kinase
VEQVKHTRAPTRLDLGGGWTDVPPYAEEQGGYVCNVAIDRYATVTVTACDDPSAPAEILVDHATDRALVAAVARHTSARGVRVELHNDFPVGAGLGGSSAATIALLAALAREPVTSRDALAELGRRIETEDLGIAGGRQDHYAAAHGGALGLAFSREVAVECIPLSAETRRAFEARCLVVYTGESRISGDTIVAVLDAYRARERGVCDALAAMARLARSMRDALAAGDLDSLSALVHEQWQHQRVLHPAIPTRRIDEIMKRAYGAGAAGAKALGASGGGCVLILAPEARVANVRHAVAPLGELLHFHVDIEGVRACP